MGIAETMILAVGLSMDAFAVSICKGLALPKVTARSAAVVGAWFGAFQGLMPLLDEEVLRIVCGDIRDMKHRKASFCPVSVNLSRLHVIRTGIVEQICRIVREAQIPAEKLSFEITESVVENEGREELAKLVRTLQEMGFQVYMDDYGTGSSTLRSLADIQFDVLKLDRSFVKLAGDPRIDVILTSTIHMACDLGMEVVAEGVETRKQAEFLLANGCRVAQGYYFSRPLPREEYFRLMKKGGGGV